MIWVSAAFVIIEPISAVMISLLVMRYAKCLGIHIWIRTSLLFVAFGLITHAAGSFELMLNYRPPRTLTWLPLFIGINAVIWVTWFTAHFRRTHGVFNDGIKQ